MEASKPVCPWCAEALSAESAVEHAMSCRARSLLAAEQPAGLFTFVREMLRWFDANL